MMASIMFILERFTDTKDPERVAADAGYTMAFTAFVLYQLVNALLVRSGDLSVFNRFSLTNSTLWLAVGGVVAAQVVVVHVPFFQEVFGTTALSASQWGWCLLATLPLLVLGEVRSAVARARHRAARSGDGPDRPAPAQASATS
jgi:Ca2+-transporting ATPase